MSIKRECLCCGKLYIHYMDEDNTWEEHFCSLECQEEYYRYLEKEAQSLVCWDEEPF